MKLTDEQVAALAAKGALPGSTSRTWKIIGDPVVQALALEVQQTRARRCDRCVHARHSEMWGLICTHLPPTGPDGDDPVDVKPSWSCADFQPKEAL